MRPRLRESLLWGAVGAMAFLVLVQGYELFADPGVGLPAKFGVALVVGALATGLTYATRRYVLEPDQD
jgi:hypothetical protein